MTAVSEVTAWVVLPSGTAVRCQSARLSLDPSWAPHASAEVVVPMAAVAEALDPRTHQRLAVVIRRAWTEVTTLGDLSAEWAGLTLDDLSAEWAGLTLGDLSHAWAPVWEAGDRPPDEVTADLALRTAAADLLAATWTLTARSDELLAQDARVTLARPVESLPTRILACLAAASIPVVASDLTLGAPYIAIPAVALTPAQSVWDHLSQVSASVGLRLVCDQTRTWRLIDPAAAPTSSVALTEATEVTDTIDLDDTWADALAVTCTWTAADGQTQLTETRTVPDPLPSGPFRVAHVEVTATAPGDSWPGPTPDEMTARLARLQAGGRVLTITAPADPTIRPGQAITTGPPSLPAADLVVGSVVWAVPADTVTLTTLIPQEA